MGQDVCLGPLYESLYRTDEVSPKRECLIVEVSFTSLCGRQQGSVPVGRWAEDPSSLTEQLLLQHES